jgi:hypothetical protein
MASVGYSGTPLWKKLGITPTSTVLLLNQPDAYLNWLGLEQGPILCKPGQSPDLVQLFVANKKQFEASMKSLKKLWIANGKLVIWVSWYKKASGIATDITEDTIRDYALANGLVDVKVCAVSEQWSGLKLVVPLAKRK